MDTSKRILSDRTRDPRRPTVTASLIGLLVTIGLLLGVATAQGSSAAAQPTFPNGLKGELQVVPNTGIVGSRAMLQGSGFDAGATLQVVWGAYDGNWKLEMKDGEYDGNFLGREFQRRSVPLASVTVGADGTFSFPFVVPEGFGGTHDIYVRENGSNVNKTGFSVRMHATMTPDSGPLGSDITLHVTGLDDLSNISGWYGVLYDSTNTGFITAVTTHGTADVVLPATGRVGKHVIKLIRSPFGQPYLAYTSSPYAKLPSPQFIFTLTDGAPVMPKPIAQQGLPSVPGSEPAGDGAKLWVDPQAAGVFADAQAHARGLPANASVELAYTEMSGSRVTAAGFQATTVPFKTVTADANGAFDVPFPIPDVLGGQHRLEAKVDGKVVATAHFTIQPVGLPLKPAEGPVGTAVQLHVKGIGWTQTNNIFAVVIDNTFYGYACGFSTNGDVIVPITASWAPGPHYIDLYPSFYRNNDYGAADEQPFLYRQATLTWHDHPNTLHFRYVFTVTE